jgi:hypothetical protein
VLSFGHEGVLYRNSFVMYDKTTDSKWLHVTGEALKGELKGSRLGFVPSEVLPWRIWKARHPMTTVLLGEKVEGFMGSYTLKDRIPSFGLSVGEGRDVTLFRFSLLDRVPVLDSSVGEQPVVVGFDRDAAYAVAFSRELEGRVLHFDALTATPGGEEGRPLMRDAETGSLWLRMTGSCLAGELKDSQLEQIPATAWLGKRWLGFFQDGHVVGLEKL